jgi:hypothetical protein
MAGMHLSVNRKPQQTAHLRHSGKLKDFMWKMLAPGGAGQVHIFSVCFVDD